VKGAVEVFQEFKQIDSKHQDKPPSTAPLSTRRLLNQSRRAHPSTRHGITCFILRLQSRGRLLPHHHAKMRVIVALLDGRVLLHLNLPWLPV
jgi:hypothetical protein